MPRPVTLFTGQWADLPIAELAAKCGGWGFDGLELASWGDFDPSHLEPQLLDSAAFVDEFAGRAGRIYQVHVKDSKRRLTA